MNAAVYARISLDLKGEGLGVDRQVQDCRALAERKGWTVVDTYVDNDVSATHSRTRPQYERMLADIEAGRIKAVVVYALDRLTRKPAELETFIDLSERHGVALANITGDVDLSTANGKMVARMLGALARGEAERMGERIKREQLQKAQQGRKHQGRWRTYGYDRQMQVIDSEAAIIREVFTRRAKGESATSIAIDMNERGIKLVSGGNWDASAVVKMIRRPDYVGDIAIKGEVVGTAAFDAIVDRPTWDLANRLVEESNNRGNNARKSLLAGFLVCGNCHAKMKSGRTKDGNVYRCPGKAVNGSCGSCSITGGQTDQYVFNAAWAKEQLSSDEPASKEPSRDFKAEQKSVQSEIDQLKAYRDAGNISLPDYVDELNRLRTRQAKLQREEAAAVSDDFGILQTMIDWEDWNLSQQRVWLDKYIAYVVVAKADRVGIKGYKPERLEVHFKDGSVQRLSKGKVVDRLSL